MQIGEQNKSYLPQTCVNSVCYFLSLSFSFSPCRSLPASMIEDISLNIGKFNIHALVIIGGFEVSKSQILLPI